MSLYPVVSIKKQSTNKISDESGFNQAICTFVCDQDVVKWEARAILGENNPPLGVGELVESGKFLKSGEDAKVYVDFNELTFGDGIYTISIYAQNILGYWSDGTFQKTYIGSQYNKKRSYNLGFKYNCFTNNY